MIPHRGLVTCSLVQCGVWVADPAPDPQQPADQPHRLRRRHLQLRAGRRRHDRVHGVVRPGGASPRSIERERHHLLGPGAGNVRDDPEAGGGATERRSGADLSSLQLIVWSGSAAPRDLIAALGTICPNLSSSYGLTESVGSLTYAAGTRRPRHPRRHYRLAVTRVRVPDRATRTAREADVGEPGEIQTRGDHIMLGYWRRPEATTRGDRRRRVAAHRRPGGAPARRRDHAGGAAQGDVQVGGLQRLPAGGRNRPRVAPGGAARRGAGGARPGLRRSGPRLRDGAAGGAGDTEEDAPRALQGPAGQLQGAEAVHHLAPTCRCCRSGRSTSRR